MSPQTGDWDYSLPTANCQLQTGNCNADPRPTPFAQKWAVNMQAHIKIHNNDNDNDAQQFVVLQENYVLLAHTHTPVHTYGEY